MTDIPADIFARATVDYIYRQVILTLRDMGEVSAMDHMTGREALNMVADNLELAMEVTTQ